MTRADSMRHTASWCDAGLDLWPDVIGSRLIAALAHAEHNAAFAGRYWPLVTKWAEYLLAKGLDPENQLCTDDFAGHLAHNTNLSIKAIEALGAYAPLAAELGHQQDAAQYEAAAKSMAVKWASMASEGDHYRLAFDKPNTWSQKYNLFPMTDWYDTVTARQVGFQVRSVVGGVYIKLLADPELWTKWVARANQNAAHSVD
jgi:hypothetical protein